MTRVLSAFTSVVTIVPTIMSGALWDNNISAFIVLGIGLLFALASLVIDN